MPQTNTIDAPLANTICFGCGIENPIGLHLHFEPHPDGGVTAAFQPAAGHQGWDGIMHGGLICVLLDESIAWAAASKTSRYVTGKLEVHYRRPVHVDKPVRLRGWIEHDHGRTLSTRAEVLSPDGEVLAEGSAVFVRAPTPR